MGDSKFSYADLEGRSYRDLQQLAKSLGLPSNFKKVYLVQLIHAKKFKTTAEVNDIVSKVRAERLRLAGARKRPPKRRNNLQGTEVSSTSSMESPPIVSTPKRRGHVILPSSPDIQQAIMKYHRPTQRPHARRQYPSPKMKQSDRVLRSFHMKPKRMLNNLVVNTQNSDSPTERTISIVSCGSTYSRMNYNNCMGRKHRPNIIQNQHTGLSRQQPVSRVYYSHAPSKRNRSLSGIYPIATKEPMGTYPIATREPIGTYNIPTKDPSVGYQCVHSVGFRRSDGRIAKINALVQKSKPRNAMTVQELINSNMTNNLDHYNIDTVPSLQYPNMSRVNNFEPNYQYSQYELADRNYQYQDPSEYYHKKIRAEQVRSQQRRASVQRDMGRGADRLPNIYDAFNKFKDVHGRDVTQPIYIQVSEESERMLNYPVFKSSVGDGVLESMYNLRGRFAPLLRLATTSATTCVYSTPVITTPMARPSTVVSNDTYVVSSCEQDSQSSAEHELMPMHEFLRMGDPDNSGRRDFREETVEDFSTSGSSLEKSQSQMLGSSATIPEMVEDALEIISQDGDYMERIGMDIRVQCILCSWAGPRFILEYHIRKVHSSQIYSPDKSECSVTYTLGNLHRNQLWLSQVVERRAALYVLSAKYEPPDCLNAALAVLSTDITPKMGHITIHNKLTGEPITWSGEIQPLSPNMPYYTETTPLSVSLTDLDLLPNTTNLNMLNRDLVFKSPKRSLIGMPELDDVNIVLNIHIMD